MEDKIEKWLKVNQPCDENIFGYGSGEGSGDGSGEGSGEGSFYGSGEGSGDGSGEGSFYGSGYSSGDDLSYGLCSSFRSGGGISDIFWDKNIKLKQGKVYLIDNIRTIITQIHGNIAKGFILYGDLTLEPTYVVRDYQFFGHGKTLKEALEACSAKKIIKLDIEEKIDEFRKKFNNKDTYSGHDFFMWHNLLTGSCLQGRESFIKNNGIDLDRKYTVKEFISICENSYGGNVIKQLKEFYKEVQE